jgi:broad specificity phosphatase PhoE
MAERIAERVRGEDITYVVSSPLERAQETARPPAEALGLEVATDDRLIEAGNVFEGKTFGVGDGSLKRPVHWVHLRNPLRPSWGEPYVEIAERMLAAIAAARDAARGHEALAVSHQLPIWTARSFATGRRLWHDPRKRQCSLASLTSFTYDGDELVSVSYEEPARDLLPSPAATGKKFVAGA